jgi:uncharacterized Zn-binding protein involved in type VI secretion
MPQPAARLTDNCIHPTVITSGSPDTVVGSLPAARLGDLVTPCPLCKTPPGKIVKGSSTVFINSKPAARILDSVACGSPGAPPGGGSHAPVSVYGVKKEDNYVETVFSDDSFLLEEGKGDMQKPPPPDKPPPRAPATFLDGLSLDIDLGSRSGSGGGGGGANAIAKGETTVIVGG